MGIITDNLTENERQEFYQGIRNMASIHNHGTQTLNLSAAVPFCLNHIGMGVRKCEFSNAVEPIPNGQGVIIAGGVENGRNYFIVNIESPQTHYEGIRNLTAGEALETLVESSPTSLSEALERYRHQDTSAILENHDPNANPIGVADDPQTEGQTHLELDETTLEPTGKSVSVDEVLANIDKALETDKE